MNEPPKQIDINFKSGPLQLKTMKPRFCLPYYIILPKGNSEEANTITTKRMYTRYLKLRRINYEVFHTAIEDPNNTTIFTQLQALTSYPGVIAQEFHYCIGEEGYYSSLYLDNRKKQKFFKHWAMNIKRFSIDLRFY